MLKNDLDRSTIPSHAGVYLFKSKGERILYIGKAKNIKKRLQQYFSPKSLWKQDMVAKAHHIQWFPTDTEEEAILLEHELIRQHAPMYNNLIKGDNAYVYLKIPHEDFPNILMTRYKKNDKAKYIGPKVRKKQLKQTLHMLRSILKYRSCSSSTFQKGVVCSDYFFGLCEGRCAYTQKSENRDQRNHKLTDGNPGQKGQYSGTKGSYIGGLSNHQASQNKPGINTQLGFTAIYTHEQAKARYAELIKTIQSFFNGNPTLLEELILADIDDAVSQQHFERAAKLRDVYTHLHEVSQQQNIALPTLKSGIFVEILNTKNWYIRAVLKIYHGKIIDIITGKEAAEESSPAEIIRVIEQEYQVKLEQHINHEHEQQFSAFQPKLNKTERQQLQQHLHNYVHAYLQSNPTNQQQITNELLSQLQERYHLGAFPYHIECVDISHFGGEHTVGAISALEAGLINKKLYRRYRIQDAAEGDDYAALEELITRRFASDKGPFPDCFVIDGGKGQLQIIKKLYNQHTERHDTIATTTFISLGKGKARSRKGKQAGQQEYICYFDAKLQIQQMPLIYDTADRLFLHLRDEAHRFANAYRKKRMKQQYS